MKLLYVKFVCVKLLYVRDGIGMGGGGRRRRRSPGYRIKNKNPTQSCGEKVLKHARKSNMPKQADRRNMPEHKHAGATIKHAATVAA